MKESPADLSVEVVSLSESVAVNEASNFGVRLFFSGALVADIQRTYAQILATLRSLQGGANQAEPDGSFLTAQELQRLFAELFSSQPSIAEEPWNCPELVEFLDGAPYPAVLKCSAVTLMKQKIKALDVAYKASTVLTKNLQAQFAELASQLHSIQVALAHQPRPSIDISESEQHIARRPSRANSCASNGTDSSMDLRPFADLTGSDSGWQSGGEPDFLSPAATTTVSSALPLKTAPQSRFNPSAPSFSPRSGGSEAPASPVKAPDQLPSSSLLGAGSYAELPHEPVLQRAVADVVNALCPQQAQVHYRDSVVALIQRNFRVALNCEALEVGLHRLLCFLPDDPVRVSAIVCRNHATKWHRVICDRLNMISKKRTDEMGNPIEGYPGQDAPEDSTGDHVIRNVLISNTKLCIQVQCSVDNTEVELLCNARADVCMLALLEEMANLVGKGDLFKQSVMLIRAWWCCETAAYVGTTVKNYLTDLSLCVMICAIFNVHHARIHTPLQALCAFLAEYSAYDGSTHAITLMGIVPFKSATSNQPVLPAPLNPTITGSAAAGEGANVLLTRPVLERYWLLFCPPDPSNPEQQQPKIMPSLSSSSEDVFGVDLRGVDLRSVPNGHLSLELGSTTSDGAGRESLTGNEDGAGTAAGPTMEDAALAAHRQQCSRNLVKFDRSQFNVVDPFSCNNMVLERPSQNRILRLTKVFQAGAEQMSGLLATAKAAAEPFDALALLKTFFPMCFVRFVETSTRPDTFSVDASFLTPAMIAQMTKRIPMQVSIDELSRQMRYCNLMIESVISRTAVLDLVVEILTQKGPLPIGEVGKALAELTCITGLSARLKEAYGGLKKFLEDFSNVVIIGTDHPFNPHIVLRASLSAENLALNDSGVFPTHAVLRMKKVTATSLRRNAYQTQGQLKPNMPMPGVPLPHQGYRPAGPGMAPSSVGMGAPRPGAYHDPRMGAVPPQPPMHGQYQHQHAPPQAQQHMMPPQAPLYQQHAPPPLQPQQYNQKMMPNMHADRGHPHGSLQVTPPLSQAQLGAQGLRGLERHGSGSSSGHSQSHGSMGGMMSHNSSGQQLLGDGMDGYDDVGGLMHPNSPGSAFNKPFGGSTPRDSAYGGQQQAQGQYGDMGYDGLRPRGDSSADMQRRGNYPPPHSGRSPDQMPRGYPAQQSAYGYDRGNQGNPSPRDRFMSGSPNTSGYGIENSFFESSAAPLISESLSLEPGSARSGSFHQRGSSFGSTSTVGIGLDRLDNAPLGSGNSGLSTRGSGSLLSGLREGSLELPGDGSSASWDLFPSQNQQPDYPGSVDWRNQNAHQQMHRKF